jgi:hypothetical protein
MEPKPSIPHYKAHASEPGPPQTKTGHGVAWRGMRYTKKKQKKTKKKKKKKELNRNDKRRTNNYMKKNGPCANYVTEQKGN